MGLRLSRLRVSTHSLPSPRPVPTPPVRPRAAARTCPERSPAARRGAYTSPPAFSLPGHHSVPGHGEYEFPASRAPSAREGSARCPSRCHLRLSAGGGKSRAAPGGGDGESSVRPAESPGGEHTLAGLPGARGSRLTRGREAARRCRWCRTPASRLHGARAARDCRVLPGRAGAVGTPVLPSGHRAPRI